jgi:HK97 family phage portal protein
VIVRTFDGLQALTPPTPSWQMPGSNGSLDLYDYRQTYLQIFKTQPNVRICSEFLGRNLAHVAPQVFRRVSDTDRIRLVDHDLARWLNHPNPATTRYRLFEALVIDVCIYDRAFWLKVRYVDADGREAIGLARLPAAEMTVEGGLLPTGFVWTVNGKERRFSPSEIFYVAGYGGGISPLETLRRILAEEAAAGAYREHFWRTGARVPGVVTRPKEVKRYTTTQAQEWREGWGAVYGGPGGEDTVLLQEGETFQQTTQSAKDSEFTVGGKLRREICAAVFQIPQPFVGILDHATFSNIKEQHKNLYQDCLGPWFEHIVQEIEGQLLVECDDQTNVYTDFNIAAKMAGSFEEQSNSLSVAVGKPYMKVNEARAKVNLPRDENPSSDEIAPQQGGPSDATAHPAEKPAKGMVRTDGGDDGSDDADAIAVTPMLEAHRTRLSARLDKLPVAERASAFFADLDRYNRELATALTPFIGAERARRRATQANAATLTKLITLEETAA